MVARGCVAHPIRGNGSAPSLGIGLARLYQKCGRANFQLPVTPAA